ncbi:MAG: hypothetical protein N2749_02250 [Clostridia bacterium]|nr:hypothetical protein [Clostridia bacterium]
MEIEKLNSEYTKSKQIFDRLNLQKDKFKDMELEVRRLIRDVSVLKIQIEQHEEDGNKSQVAIEQKELQTKLDQIREMKDKLAKYDEALSKANEQVDAYIQQISNNPEIKKQLNEALMKKLQREIFSKGKERNELEAKNNKYKNFIAKCDEDPNIRKNLDKIAECKKRLDELAKEPQPLSGEKLKEANSLKASMRRAKEKISNITNGEISPEFFDKITSYDEFKCEIKSNDKYIIGLNKIISNNEIAHNKCAAIIDNSINSSDPINSKKGYGQYENNGTISNLPTITEKTFGEKIGQFFKNVKTKIMNYINGNDKGASASSTAEPQSNSQQEVSDKNNFRDVLKYGIAKDVMETMKTDALREAKKERKAKSSEDKSER